MVAYSPSSGLPVPPAWPTKVALPVWNPTMGRNGRVSMESTMLEAASSISPKRPITCTKNAMANISRKNWAPLGAQ